MGGLQSKTERTTEINSKLENKTINITQSGKQNKDWG